MTIPFVDLYAQYLTIQDDIDSAIKETILKSSYIGGKSVSLFEKAFAEYTGIQNIVACANGTDSLEIILKAWKIGKGDEVIVPAHSWISTSEAVSNVGAKPVFVDVEEDYFTLDVSLIEKAITLKTKAIIPVHLYGHPVNMPQLMDIAKRHNLLVLEDCAQSHGASINGKKVGTFGDAASFSFYPGKNLGAYGDAGCMATNDDIMASEFRMIANHGQKGKHNHIIEGRNSRLDGLQAAILLAKLPYLEKWTEMRIRNAETYISLLNQANIIVPKTKSSFRHVFHLFVIKVGKREMLMNLLKENNIETAIHYPVSLPLLPCYQINKYKPEDFPVAYKNQSVILSLPFYPELSLDQIELVSTLINEFQNVSF